MKNNKKLLLSKCVEDCGERLRIAKMLTYAFGMREREPYNNNPGIWRNTYRWSIDVFGNNFWLEFDKENTQLITLSCRYDDLEPTLVAFATYIAYRLNAEVLQ